MLSLELVKEALLGHPSMSYVTEDGTKILVAVTEHDILTIEGTDFHKLTNEEVAKIIEARLY